MVKIEEVIKWGLNCPSCGSTELHACYHDFQTNDSFICDKCGLRWMEDIGMGDQASWESDLKRRLRNYKDEMGERFIWVLHVAKEPNYALKNSESADGVDRSQFIRDGLAWMHARPVSKREEEEEG